MITKSVRNFLLVILLSSSALQAADEGLMHYLDVFAHSFIISAAWQGGARAAEYLFREHPKATLIGAASVVAGVIIYKEVQHRKKEEHHKQHCGLFKCTCN